MHKCAAYAQVTTKRPWQVTDPITTAGWRGVLKLGVLKLDSGIYGLLGIETIQFRGDFGAGTQWRHN
jgi:hypothetical protein